MNKSCRYCGKTHDINFECEKKPKRKFDRTDRNAAFRRTNKWKKKSQQIMQRDLYLCQSCLKYGKITTDGLSVHHIIPLSVDFNKRLDDDNLITLCADCHRRAELKIDNSFVGASIACPQKNIKFPPG